MRILTLLLASLLFSCKEEGGGGTVNPAATVLREKAAYGIGVAIKSSLFTEAAYQPTVKKHFSQVSAEWEMKMQSIWTSANVYNYDGADKVVNFATTNGLDVHGHTLVWYRSYPDWLRNAKYDSATFESQVKKYIESTVNRYRGKVISWDVANEIFNDNGTLRSVNCPVYATFKDPIGFYGRCFRYAHEADPQAKLFYNDYSVTLVANKRAAIKRMITRFRNEGVPIHGVGDQFHYRVTTDKAALKTGMADLGSTGLLIHISELDMVMNTAQSDAYEYSGTEATKQANMYQYIAEIFEALPQNQKFAITLWGVSDKHSWLVTDWHRKEYPLLFDDNYKEKLAYKGLLSGIKL